MNVDHLPPEAGVTNEEFRRVVSRELLEHLEELAACKNGLPAELDVHVLGHPVHLVQSDDDPRLYTIYVDRQHPIAERINFTLATK